MTCSTSTTGQIVLLLLTLIGSHWLHHRTVLGADDDVGFRFRCEAIDEAHEDSTLIEGIRWSSLSPGDLIAPAALPNRGSWKFDGVGAIAYAIPSDTPGLAENFTWEGFFLSPSSNTFLQETGIADRLLTQFAFDKGDWTRLAIGLVADGKGFPRLCVELEGFEGRTFGMGDCNVSADRWHHFALVHEGTAAAAKIRWYLDYELTGELFLGGQSNQNTLRPPGKAPLAIGARLSHDQHVNRGIEGFIDEVRLVPRPLKVEEFLRVDGAIAEQVVDTGLRDLQQREQFWDARHHWARQQAARWAHKRAGSSIDAHIATPAGPISDAAFLRRLSLAVRGRIPSLDEVISFLAEEHPDKRSRIIDQFLASPEWADGWVGYWQDVLAENPSVVFPTLNNSGAFRQWIYDSFRENKPFDRFVTELILMDGAGAKGSREDGPAGFALAAGNDAPMAMRSLVAMRAFAAVDFKCARCHDSPFDELRQSDLFLTAAYLNGGPLEVPATSVAAVGKAGDLGVITTSLTAGQMIVPSGLSSHWLSEPEDAASLQWSEPGPRGQLAALITSPRSRRFSDVIVNRTWKRYFGRGLIEPVDQWHASPTASHGELLDSLSAQFVTSGYDIKALARRIFRSEAWQAERQRRSRMSAEQLIDSLFVAVGKQFESETLGVHATDPGAVQLPPPDRAWQFSALPNERDRPSLGMPVNQTIVDAMTTFGWNGSRQQPRSEREQTTSALQPLMLFNGIMSQRIVRLSERSSVTELCLQDVPVSTLVDQLFLTLLSRPPDENEQQHFVNFLSPSYAQRQTGETARPVVPLSTFQPDWRKHLQPEQTRLMLQSQRSVARGEPPTSRLAPDFRERVEDVLWALINSPEFVVIP